MGCHKMDVIFKIRKECRWMGHKHARQRARVHFQDPSYIWGLWRVWSINLALCYITLTVFWLKPAVSCNVVCCIERNVCLKYKNAMYTFIDLQKHHMLYLIWDWLSGQRCVGECEVRSGATGRGCVGGRGCVCVTRSRWQTDTNSNGSYQRRSDILLPLTRSCQTPAPHIHTPSLTSPRLFPDYSQQPPLYGSNTSTAQSHSGFSSMSEMCVETHLIVFLKVVDKPEAFTRKTVGLLMCFSLYTGVVLSEINVKIKC